MLNRAKGWFGGLNLVKKIGVSFAAFFVSMTALGMALPPQQSANNKDVSTTEQKQEISIKSEDTLDKVETKEIAETEVIPFETITEEDPDRTKGETFQAVAGVNGERTIKYTVKYQDGKEIERTKISDEVTKQPITKVIKVGTYVAPTPAQNSNCDPNYSGGCVPIASDVDCAGGSGNGPAYVAGPVQVIGYDKYGLDADDDGIGCE